MSGDGRGQTIVIGAGPSGLAAALTLRRGGHDPLLLERDSAVGGLMRSPRWREFTVDLGRKELYARFPEVDALWSDALGPAYVPYPHRVGSLYRGRIIEMSGRYRGPLRGMPPGLLVRGGLGLLWGWAHGARRAPRTLEEHWHARVGRPFAEAMAQGYWEKFRGVGWADMPPPDGERGARPSGSALGDAVRAARLGGRSAQTLWHHPERGTGQLFEALARKFQRMGGRLTLGAEVEGLEPRADGRLLVAWRANGQRHRTLADQVVSSLPIERLWTLVRDPNGAAPGLPSESSPSPHAERSVLLVYLFLDAPPRFPHAWLEVNDPDLTSGRVTNYAAFGGAMVPPERTALCVEFFLSADAPLLALPESERIERAVAEVEGAGLIDRRDLVGSMALHLPRTNAAASWREQQEHHRAALLDRLSALPALYHTNRPGSDWASLAGMQAARAILNGDRAAFDRAADPTRRQEDRLAQPATTPHPVSA